MALSLRLSLIASLVPKGARVCDIGTDHAFLPIELISSGKANRVIATDIREKPLKNAKKNIEEANITDIDIRLCDGLSGVGRNEVDTVVITGMGGEVISSIIDNAKWLKEDCFLLILQPTTSPEHLRKYLANNGFEILTDTALSENGKIYSVMTVKFTGANLNLPESYLYIGKVDSQSDDGFKYIEKQYSRIKSAADALKNVPYKQDEYIHLDRLSKEIGEHIWHLTEASFIN